MEISTWEYKAIMVIIQHMKKKCRLADDKKITIEAQGVYIRKKYYTIKHETLARIQSVFLSNSSYFAENMQSCTGKPPYAQEDKK